MERTGRGRVAAKVAGLEQSLCVATQCLLQPGAAALVVGVRQQCGMGRVPTEEGVHRAWRHCSCIA